MAKIRGVKIQREGRLEMSQENGISMREIIGGGYDEFWRSKKRYVVCKGSRASKKSTTAALKLIVRLMQMPPVNALQLTYLPTGQKIIFRGCDDSLKITSIAVERGHLCFVWGRAGNISACGGKVCM